MVHRANRSSVRDEPLDEWPLEKSARSRHEVHSRFSPRAARGSRVLSGRRAGVSWGRMVEFRPADTSGAAWELTRAAHARLGPEGRLRAAFEASEFVRSIARLFGHDVY